MNLDKHYSLPGQMRAWRWLQRDNGITLETLSLPQLEAGMVLVANRMIGLNPVDWKFIDKMGQEKWRDGQVPGVDGAGEVVSVAAGGDNSLLGKRVCYHTSLLADGSFADYTAVPARALIPLPDKIDWATASSFPCPTMTAWQAIEKIPAQDARRILISGASGPVGRSLIQLAKARGFHVTALATEKRHADLTQLGADRCIADLPGAGPFYAVFDTVSGEHARLLASLVAANGHLICIQDRLESPAVAAFTTAISQHEVALGALHSFGDDAHWHELVAAAEGLLEKVVTHQFELPQPHIVSFENLAAALREFRDEHKFLKYAVAVR